MYNWGVLYSKGQGFVQDYGKASEWFQKAADAGDAGAMFNLGVLYFKGEGVAQNYDKAGEWIQKAADAGNTNAKEALKELSTSARSKSRRSGSHH
jgi:uncharacterized protein